MRLTLSKACEIACTAFAPLQSNAVVMEHEEGISIQVWNGSERCLRDGQPVEAEAATDPRRLEQRLWDLRNLLLDRGVALHEWHFTGDGKA